jgi:Caspase domain
MNYFNTITRKAVLIGSPGNPGSFLKGVRHDIKNMRRFLQSTKGGQWKSNEIVELYNPSLNDVAAILVGINQDYSLIYFSGHGYTELATRNRMVKLRDYSIQDTSLLCRSPKQLVIVDACRSFSAPGLSGIPQFEDDVDHFEGISTYELFSEYIAYSPQGKLIVHATQPGRFSYDSPSGGYFTQALLQVSTRMRADVEYAPCAISSVLHHVPKLLHRNNNPQVPTIAYSEGMLTVPFALATIKSGSSLMGKDTGSKELVGALVVLGLVGLVIAASN